MSHRTALARIPPDGTSYDRWSEQPRSMDFDRNTLVLLILRDDAPALDGPALDALQDAHLAHLADLHDAGPLLAAGPSPGAPDRRVRGSCIFRVGPDEARALEDRDPIVRAGRFSVEVHPWIVPRGAMHFSRTRFPVPRRRRGAAELARGRFRHCDKH